MPTPDPGLCAKCHHAQPVPAARSNFWKCGLAAHDPRFPRYPPLPVRECVGYEPEGAERQT